MAVPEPSEGLILIDYNDKVLVKGNTPCVIEGYGNCMIAGDADALRHCKIFGDGQ